MSSNPSVVLILIVQAFPFTFVRMCGKGSITASHFWSMSGLTFLRYTLVLHFYQYHMRFICFRTLPIYFRRSREFSIWGRAKTLVLHMVFRCFSLDLNQSLKLLRMKSAKRQKRKKQTAEETKQTWTK